MAEGPICLFDDYLRVMNKREPTWTKISRNLHLTDKRVLRDISECIDANDCDDAIFQIKV